MSIVNAGEHFFNKLKIVVKSYSDQYATTRKRRPFQSSTVVFKPLYRQNKPFPFIYGTNLMLLKIETKFWDYELFNPSFVYQSDYRPNLGIASYIGCDFEFTVCPFYWQVPQFELISGITFKQQVAMAMVSPSRVNVSVTM